MVNGINAARSLWASLVAFLLVAFMALTPLPVFAEPSGNPVFHHPISSPSQLAQQHFDQGLLLAYGFNHAEALRSFQSATIADPNCAICHWGIAYVLGPNINTSLMEEEAAWAALQTTVSLQEYATPVEQAYIQALAHRYSPTVGSDRQALNLAYAEAMRQLARQYPDDLDAATLFAEALMDTTPWDYWQENGEPKPVHQDVLNTLASVLQRQPQHPGALHFYIHAVEAKHPEWAIEAADRLNALQIPIGHLAHMPSHIYLGVGRYQDAVAANQWATELDTQYAKSHPRGDLYLYAYRPHNYHVLWYAALMAGQKQVALEAAQNTARLVDLELAQNPVYGTLQHYLALPLYTLIRFNQWTELVAQSAPPDSLLYLKGIWHYARGMALAHQDRSSEATQELQRLQKIVANPALKEINFWEINSAATLLQIATAELTGEIAFRRGQLESAVETLRRAVSLEDSLRYDEPPPWYAPTRQKLAELLLNSDRAGEAEQLYREDLAQHPGNGWSLYGLAQSLRSQGKIEAGQQVERQFKAVWRQADVQPTLASQKMAWENN